MNEELEYAEMLEIPVETVTVKRREKRRRAHEDDLSDQLVEQVNDRMEEAQDPAFAESKPIETEVRTERRPKLARRLIVGEFIAVCVLCAVIFLTNIFLTDSAINTFVRGLFHGSGAAATDNRKYSDFSLSSVVSEYTDAEITVSETGVLSFTAQCSVYSPCDGTVSALNGNDESGYTLQIKHSENFTTIMSGLSAVYCAQGDTVYSNLPIAYSNGENSVRVMFYSGDTLLNCYTVGENGIAWS